MADFGAKISELPAADALTGTELLPGVQGGQTKKATAAQIATLVKSGLTKNDVGLGNVANERQYSANNPPPTPTPAEIGAVPETRTVNGKALSADVTLDAEDVGAIPEEDKGVAGGVAELDENGRIPTAQLPSYVDDVQEYASVAAFPATGEAGKIYVALDTNLTYRWSGTAYVEISPSLALGETSSTAYRGDRGKVAYDFSQAPYTSDPAMDGTASPGSSGAWARGDHVHPKDTSKQDALTWDNSPTEGSNNPVKSGGIYDAILALLPTDTASGNPANFPDGADGAPVVDLTAEIALTQPGSGIPSPTNIRPITGRTGLTISHSGADTSDPEIIAVSWESEAGTVYGGIYDAISGELSVTWADLDMSSAYFSSRAQNYINARMTLPNGVTNILSDRFSDQASSGTPGKMLIALGDLYFNIPIAQVSSYDTAGVQAWLAEYRPQFMYELAVPITYQVTPHEVKTLLGENNIWANTGAVTVTYRANLPDYLARKLPSTMSTLSVSRPALTLGAVEPEGTDGQEEQEEAEDER